MLQVYNTMTRQKEELVPAERGRVTIYVCGPTTYNYIHLGNARPLVFFDTLRRYLGYHGLRVTYVQNFTDIDDKVIARAREEGLDPLALSDCYIREYFKDAQALGVLPADAHPRVSAHLGDIIEMIKGLLAKGFAYTSGGDVYFEVRRFPAYGRLARRSLEELQAGARVEVNELKRDPLDFVLWKGARLGEPAWESPWGPGRPGWHIECSAMSLRHLGSGFDIHGGGADLIFPHHENEIAQSEALTGLPMARYWLHNGYITVNQEKMAKSKGNFFLVRDILKEFSGQVVRFYLLSTHYRNPLDFSDEGLRQSRRALERLQKTRRMLREATQPGTGDIRENPPSYHGTDPVQRAVQRCRQDFQAAMDDDLNTAGALGAVFSLVREVNSHLDGPESEWRPCQGGLAAAAVLLEQLVGEVLGVLDASALELGREERINEPNGFAEGLMELLVDLRQEVRLQKQWSLADTIRSRLGELGVNLEDKPGGRTTWSLKELPQGEAGG